MSNTYSSALLTEKLEETAVTILSDTLAPLNSFAKQFGVDAYKPLAPVEVKFTTVADDTLTDPSDFETGGDSTVTNVQVVPHHLCQNFHVTSAELNSGMRLADILTKNARKFGETLLDAAFDPITTSNFATACTRSASAFAFSDMATARGLLKKSPVKNAVLDGEYFARLSNTPVFYQKAPTESGAGWQVFGWNGIYECSRWSGAGANIRGFFCGETAIGCLAGLPLIPALARNLETKTFTVPGLDLTVQINTWFALSSRTLWASLDCMFGASLLDATCGFLLKDS
jgi:hypothetical protein